MLRADPVIPELSRRLVAEGRVPPFPVVKRLNVPEGHGCHFPACRKAFPMHPLVLETIEPALSRGVVPAVTRLTVNSLNSVAYSCFGIFIVFPSIATAILRHPWKTIFRGSSVSQSLTYRTFITTLSSTTLVAEIQG